MKFTIITDEKPRACTDCPFYIIENITNNKLNKPILAHKCLLGGVEHKQCPLTEVKTIWEI